MNLVSFQYKLDTPSKRIANQRDPKRRPVSNRYTVLSWVHVRIVELSPLLEFLSVLRTSTPAVSMVQRVVLAGFQEEEESADNGGRDVQTMGT